MTTEMSGNTNVESESDLRIQDSIREGISEAEVTSFYKNWAHKYDQVRKRYNKE